VTAVAYFAALLARTDDGWEPSDIDLDQVDDLESLADLMRDTAVDEQPVLLFLEQEDLWFAVVRVDGDEDPRVFVSDRTAVAHSAYAEMLLSAEEDVLEDIDAVEADDVDEVDEDTPPPVSGPAGDADVLSDLGTPEAELLALCSREGILPTDALTVLAERAGAVEALESVR
jgi:putative tRNA adenosine deaminase-associated protein